MRSDDATPSPVARGWFRTCPRVAPLRGSAAAASRFPSPEAAPPPAGTQDEDDNDDADGTDGTEGSGSGWDGRYLGFGVPFVGAERRHSGWEAVEKRWGTAQPPPHRASERDEAKTPAWAEDAVKKRPTTDFACTPGIIINDDDDDGRRPTPAIALPPPQLEPDFRLRLVLSTAGAALGPSDPNRQWRSVAGGAWAGKLGRGLVMGGGQETLQLPMGNGMLATQVEAKFQMRTGEDPPAIIECRAKGVADAGRAPSPAPNPADAAGAAPRPYPHRMVLIMRTADARYAEAVNVGLWVATCLWLGNEVIYDAHRVV